MQRVLKLSQTRYRDAGKGVTLASSHAFNMAYAFESLIESTESFAEFKRLLFNIILPKILESSRSSIRKE